MLHDRLLSTYMPFSTLAIMSSNDELPGSKFMFAILSMGALFQELALKLATPSIPDLT